MAGRPAALPAGLHERKENGGPGNRAGPEFPVRFPGSFLDEIRARVPLSSVVSRTVRLRKAGKEWRGLSPFNRERNPSFYVNDEKRFYHCFSSGRHGDVFSFLMEVEGLGFPEAVERLAGEAGLPLPSANRADDGRAGLDAAMEEAVEFFRGALEAPEGAAAREYLDGRGIGPEARARFGIGYAPPQRRALRDRLAARGVPAEVALDLGLVVPSADVAGPYDRFRDRVVFPVSDARGRTVGFAGRALGPKASAKYLNTPETAIFRKGSLLYNQHRARAAAKSAGFVVCVEGYTDAIALDGAGMANVVSAMGTALTPEQLDLLWGLAPEAVLCFDGDDAGRRAAARAARAALPRLGEGRGLRFALLPRAATPTRSPVPPGPRDSPGWSPARVPPSTSSGTPRRRGWRCPRPRGAPRWSAASGRRSRPWRTRRCAGTSSRRSAPGWPA